MMKVCYFFLVKQLLSRIFVMSLSLFFLGACAGRAPFQEREKDIFSLRPTRTNLEETQEKPPSSNPLAYYYFLLSQLKLREGKVDAAIEDLKEAIAQDAQEPSLHVELATLYIQKGLLNEAIEEFRQSPGQAPGRRHQHRASAKGLQPTHRHLRSRRCFRLRRLPCRRFRGESQGGPASCRKFTDRSELTAALRPRLRSQALTPAGSG